MKSYMEYTVGNTGEGGKGENARYGFQKREKFDLWAQSCVGVIKISFSFTLNKEIHALRTLLLRVKR